MKHRVYKLLGTTLDWAVAQCLGYQEGDFCVQHDTFSTNPAAAYPIIEREKIEVRWIITDANGGGYWSAANLFTDTYGCSGPTPLIAAMRCFVESKLGNAIEIPEVLL